MKKVCLLEGPELFWPTVRTYFYGINVETVRLTSGDDPAAMDGSRPDLFVASEDHPALATLAVLRRAVIVLHEGTPPSKEALGGNRRATLLKWPVAKREFLKKTAGILDLAPRRDFRTLIRVGLEGDRIDSLAESKDFSLTGMSFKSSNYYNTGSRIVISVSLPKLEKSHVFHGRVMRTFTEEGDEVSSYGIEFLDLEPSTIKTLEDFILA